MARIENTGRCSAMNAYLTLHPWRRTRPFFQDVALLGDPLQLALQPTHLGGLIVIAGHRSRFRVSLLPLVEGVFADPQPRRHLRNRIASLGDLKDRLALEVLGEVRLAHRGLLASKLGKKASRNLGAVQLALPVRCGLLASVRRVIRLWSMAT
jgi:hypothetical protein